LQPRSAMLCVCLILNVCLNAAEAQAPPHDTNAPLTAGRPQIAIVGTYHFVSKANVHSMPVDDPMTPKRQAEIEDLVRFWRGSTPVKLEQIPEVSGRVAQPDRPTEAVGGQPEPAEPVDIG